jgi:hypothetical protein
MATAMYVLIGLLYSLVGIPMILSGNEKLRILGIVYACMPVLMAILGFIFFCIFAAIYNLLARWLGGFEFEITEVP